MVFGSFVVRCDGSAVFVRTVGDMTNHVSEIQTLRKQATEVFASRAVVKPKRESIYRRRNERVGLLNLPGMRGHERIGRRVMRPSRQARRQRWSSSFEMLLSGRVSEISSGCFATRLGN